MTDKVFWIGDDRDNKSVCINREVYVKGGEIPADDVAPELIAEWLEAGLIAVGAKAAPVVIVDTEVVKNLKTEIASLGRDVERIPGLERKIADLEKSAEKRKDGTKAKKLKELEGAVKVKDTHIKELEENAIKQSNRIKELEDIGQERIKKITALDLDNQEKAALIDKLNIDLDEATKPDDEGAGPGGGK